MRGRQPLNLNKGSSPWRQLNDVDWLARSVKMPSHWQKNSRNFTSIAITWCQPARIEFGAYISGCGL